MNPVGAAGPELSRTREAKDGRRKGVLEERAAADEEPRKAGPPLTDATPARPSAAHTAPLSAPGDSGGRPGDAASAAPATVLVLPLLVRALTHTHCGAECSELLRLYREERRFPAQHCCSPTASMCGSRRTMERVCHPAWVQGFTGTLFPAPRDT
ncbi:hypothetical protein MRX96_010415 [Rhipicephalus microplus]